MAVFTPANPIAARIFDQVLPATRGWPDENVNQLIRFIEGWTVAAVDIETIVRDTDAGPGWSAVLDVDRAPDMFLDWLAMFYGVRRTGPTTPSVLRGRIRGVTGLHRGSVESLRAAAQQYLTGTKYVAITERSGSAYRMRVGTRISETPNPAMVEAAVLEQKPAGIVLIYELITGGDFDTVRTTWPSFDVITAVYLDFNELRAQPSKRAGWAYADVPADSATYSVLASNYVNYTDLITPRT